MKRRALVLGGGPAGLLAAHAATECGLDVTVLAKTPRPSPMYGAQYLHAEIPGIDCGKPVQMSYMLEGSVQGYAKKLGYPSDTIVSAEILDQHHKAWDIRLAYNELRKRYPVSAFRIFKAKDMPDALDEYDEVISTIPAPDLCLSPAFHKFRSVSVWAASTAMVDCPDNTVRCNGEPYVPWYRVSKVFGHSTIEWPHSPDPPGGSPMLVEKPLGHDCYCWGTILRTGRYGSWLKSKLASDAYFDTLKFLREE